MFHDIRVGGLSDILISIWITCRHSRGLQSIIYTLSQSARELGLLVLILIITGLAFSSLAYYIEQVNNSSETLACNFIFCVREKILGLQTYLQLSIGLL